MKRLRGWTGAIVTTGLVCVLLGLTTGWGDGDGAFFLWCLGVVLLGAGAVRLLPSQHPRRRLIVGPVVLLTVAVLVLPTAHQRVAWARDVAWSSQEDEGLEAADADTLYTFDGERLRARAVRDGAVRWSRTGSISRAWTTGELLVLRLADGSGLVALSAADGTDRWRSDVQGEVGARSDGVLVVSAGGRTTSGDEACDGGCPLTGIDLVTGQTRWTLADTNPAFLGLPLSNGLIPTGPVPTVRHLAVYDELAPGAATPERERLRVLAVDTGAVERTESVPATTRAQVAIVGDRLLVIERVPDTYSLGMLRAVPLSSGILGWQARVDGITRLSRLGLLAPGDLLVRHERDRTTFLDLQTGKSTEVSMPRGWRERRFGDQGDRILATTGGLVLLNSDRDAPSGPVVADLTTGTARTFEKPPRGRVPDAVAGTTLAYEAGPFQDVPDGRDVFGRQPTQLLLIDLESEQGVEHVTLRLHRENYGLRSAADRLIVPELDRFHVLEQQ